MLSLHMKYYRDLLDTGFFRVNIHHSGNNPVNDIGRYSAGCQVIRSISDFAQLMQIIKGEPRWQANHSYIFKYTLLWGRWL